MVRGALRTLTVGSISVIALSASAHLAQAQPDLVIERSDSELEFVSCDKSQPLAKGRIVIRNEGDSDANLRQAEDLFRSFLAVYNPENIDLIAKEKKRTKMEPREQRAIVVEVGRGKVKSGRNYNGVPGADGDGSSYSGRFADVREDLSDDEVKTIQQFLTDRGYNVGGVDGAWGGKTTRALASFQKVAQLSQTDGEWDAESGAAITKFLDSSGGGAVVSGPTNVKDEDGKTRITVFAVVDPYNLIDESDESNNIVAYTGWLNCD